MRRMENRLTVGYPEICDLEHVSEKHIEQKMVESMEEKGTTMHINAVYSANVEDRIIFLFERKFFKGREESLKRRQKEGFIIHVTEVIPCSVHRSGCS
jgi:hypothetical protein